MDWRVMSTSDNGIPQARRRVYIIGIRRDVQRHPFAWPKPVGAVPLDSLLDPAGPDEHPFSLPDCNSNVVHTNIVQALEKTITKGLDVHAPASVDQGSSHGGLMVGKVPTLTATRCAGGGFWLLHRGRYTKAHELLQLQGLRPRRFVKLGNMTRNQFNHAVGNAMSGNVLTRIVASLLRSVYGPHAIRDPWADPHTAARLLLFWLTPGPMAAPSFFMGIGSIEG